MIEIKEIKKNNSDQLKCVGLFLIENVFFFKKILSHV